jgi:hypothetical protein
MAGFDIRGHRSTSAAIESSPNLIRIHFTMSPLQWNSSRIVACGSLLFDAGSLFRLSLDAFAVALRRGRSLQRFCATPRHLHSPVDDRPTFSKTVGLWKSDCEHDKRDAYSFMSVKSVGSDIAG